MNAPRQRCRRPMYGHAGLTWLNKLPNINLFRLEGQATSMMGKLNRHPKVSRFSPGGNATRWMGR